MKAGPETERIVRQLQHSRPQPGERGESGGRRRREGHRKRLRRRLEERTLAGTGILCWSVLLGAARERRGQGLGLDGVERESAGPCEPTLLVGELGTSELPQTATFANRHLLFYLSGSAGSIMSQAYSTPSIPPDALHLSLYPESSIASSRPATLALAAQLRSVIDELLPPDWIWHRDPLELKVEELKSRPKGGETQWVIRGGMRVGESIEDEWVGVWLVRELTRRFPDVVGS